MNIGLKVLIGIGGFILLSILLGLIKEMLYLIRESHTIKMYDSKTDRLDLLTNIYTTASNVYLSLAQKGVVLVDYAYLAEVAIYGMVSILGGDTTTLLQKIQQFMNKSKDTQGGGKTIIITPGPKGPKAPKTDKPKKKLTDKDINELLDKWEKEHPNWRNKEKKKDNGLSK